MEAYIKNSKFYDAAKWVALIGLPLTAAAYYSLGDLWSFPETERVVGTLTIIDTLLGGYLGLSKKAYDKSDAKYDGVMTVEDQGDGVVAGMEFLKHEDARELVGLKELTFKVISKT